jgi:hypothetical protein
MSKRKGREEELPVLLTPLEVATMLYVKEHTLWGWRRCKAHTLPYIRKGRRIFYKESDVKEFIKKEKLRYKDQKNKQQNAYEKNSLAIEQQIDKLWS